jgi:proline iminopeptidase
MLARPPQQRPESVAARYDRLNVDANQDYVTTTDGVRLFAQVLGSGAKTVIVPNASFLLDVFRGLADDYTVIFYDLRNRGRSETVSDPSKLKRGIHHDVADLEDVRQHFGVGEFDLIGHSYLGLMVILYAMEHPDRIRRIVQIGSMPPDQSKQYPAHLTGADAVMLDVSAKMAQLQKEGPSGDVAEFGRKIWSVMRTLYVANPADAERVPSAADVPNESLGNIMKHWSENLWPSIQPLKFAPDAIARVTAPVLVVHGTRDRQSPYGGGREWATMLPNARLVTVDNAAHLPWIEAPERVLGSIRTFLGGEWPDSAQKIESVELPA